MNSRYLKKMLPEYTWSSSRQPAYGWIYRGMKGALTVTIQRYPNDPNAYADEDYAWFVVAKGGGEIMPLQKWLARQPNLSRSQALSA